MHHSGKGDVTRALESPLLSSAIPWALCTTVLPAEGSQGEGDSVAQPISQGDALPETVPEGRQEEERGSEIFRVLYHQGVNQFPPLSSGGGYSPSSEMTPLSFFTARLLLNVDDT